MALGVCMLACAGCLGGGSLGGDGPTGSGGSVGTGGVRGRGGSVGTGGTGPTRFCGEVDVPLYTSARVDVLLLLDRSSSMNDDSNEMSCSGGCGASSKWALLSATIDRLVTTHPSVNWGLALFGSDNACGVNPGVVVDVAQDAASSIQRALAATTPAGNAPTAAAIDGAIGYLQSRDESNPKYILLATDGRSDCATGGGGAAGADAEAEEAIARARDYYGISTFVLGLTPASDAAATATLNQMAENGGNAAPGQPTAFSTLDTIDAQISVFASVGPPANSCTVALAYPLGPSTSLAVSITPLYGQSTQIPQDPLAGWSFTSPDESAIDISGYFCTGLQSGGYSYMAIIYLCRIPPPGRSGPIAR